jgi:hypothetical protein
MLNNTKHKRLKANLISKSNFNEHFVLVLAKATATYLLLKDKYVHIFAVAKLFTILTYSEYRLVKVRSTAYCYTRLH